MWGYENLGIEPDGFTLAKGLGGGHAIGALLVKEKLVLKRVPLNLTLNLINHQSVHFVKEDFLFLI